MYEYMLGGSQFNISLSTHKDMFSSRYVIALTTQMDVLLYEYIPIQFDNQQTHGSSVVRHVGSQQTFKQYYSWLYALKSETGFDSNTMGSVLANYGYNKFWTQHLDLAAKLTEQ